MGLEMIKRQQEHTDQLIDSHSPPLEGGPQCVAIGYGQHPGPQS